MQDDFLTRFAADDPLVADHLPIEEQRCNIDYFGRWLSMNKPGWFILPPASVYTSDGRERLLFVLRQHDRFIGMFKSPFQALQKIGDGALTSAFYLHMRTRRPGN